MKYIPTRMCVVCRSKGAKENFIRIARKNNEFYIAEDAKIEGRSYYICKKIKCVEIAVKKKILNKVCKCDCREEIYIKLKGIECGQD